MAPSPEIPPFHLSPLSKIKTERERERNKQTDTETPTRSIHQHHNSIFPLFLHFLHLNHSTRVYDHHFIANLKEKKLLFPPFAYIVSDSSFAHAGSLDATFVRWYHLLFVHSP